MKSESEKYSKSYKQTQIEEQYDAILIGSGIGSLISAALLSKMGKRCLVLERHYTAGGYTHTFKRKKYEWDVGVHYIGEVMRPTSVLSRLFRYVAGDRIEWADMGEVYDRIRFGDEVFPFVKGREAFADSLKSQFPNQADCTSIDLYIETIRDAARQARGFFTEKALPSLMAKVVGGSMRKGFLSYAQKTTLEVLKGITQNPKLIAVLTGQYGDYGLPPAQSSFAMHAMVVRHYLEGGAYPVGGSAAIFNGIAPTITETGGCILTNAEVKRVLIQKGKAIGVEMKDGQTLHAPIVISGAGIATTAQHLFEEEEVDRLKLLDSLHPIKHSAAHLCLYLGFNRSTADLNLSPANWWYYPAEYDHDALIQRFFNDPNEEFPLIYTSFPSAKDPSWDARFDHRSTVEVITVAPYEWFSQWEQTRWHKRGQAYDDFKENLTQRMLGKLYELEPQLKAHLDHCELSTPLSTQHFCNYDRGEIYGLDHTPHRFTVRHLRPQTALKGFYLTGQDVATAGVGGAMMGGVLCASAILKKNMMKEILTA